MRHAIELAKKGVGRVNPNPLVGAVIVKEDKVIGEGYHKVYGDLHAERNAFLSLADPEEARGAQMYVTLEPCCHHGKQPPCTEAIIRHGISKVYVGSSDPNELVAGKGISQLKEAGICVETGVLKKECDALNPVFFHYITHKTPYVLMKYAMTLDGKIATYTGHSQWISGEASRERVQETRNALTGIMVGIGTVLQDNPRLTCRREGGRNPIRIVCDSHLRIPLDCNLVETAGEIPLIVATILPEGEDTRWQEKKSALEKKGVEVCITKNNQGKTDLQDLMRQLGERQVDGILLEGGSSLNYAALKAGIVNGIQVYVSPKIFGGKGVYTPVGGEGVALATEGFGCSLVSVEQIGEDVLLTYHVSDR
jgi:diaminohydroxyphosphoribosylaminopyrimidine deaminase/5-amino-6-(5-phosphoribosylamino)uracil reductase